jgi:MFS family permease
MQCRKLQREDHVQTERLSVAVVFAVTGATFATWAARVPAIQDRLHLSEGQLGLALLGLTAGAVVGLPAAGALVSRWGNRRLTALGFTVYCLGLILVAGAPSLPLLVAALAAFGAGNSAVDVGMSVQGIATERRYARPLMSGFNAMFSIGTVAGAAAGTVAAAVELSVILHFAIAAGVLLFTGLAAASRFQGRSTHGAEHARLRLPDRRLLLLGLIAFAAFITEGVMQDWSAVYLRAVGGASPGIAAAGFAAFVAAMTIGRLAGDRVVLRAGPRSYTIASAGTAMVGFAVVVTAPSTAAAVTGYVLVGLGLAGLAPVVFSLAGHHPSIAEGPAVAAVSTIGYFGFLAGPPLVGGIAEATDLRVAMAVVSSFAIFIVAVGRRLPARHPTADAHI